MTTRCKHCPQDVNPCPVAAGWPKHGERGPCKGWIHADGTHSDGVYHGTGHLAEPASPPKAPAEIPRSEGGEAAAEGASAAATPGTPEVTPITDDGVPGTLSSRPGRAQQPAAGAGTSGVQAWKDALAAHHQAQRNQRGKWRPKGRNPFGNTSGVRIPPPGDGAP